MLFKHCGLKLIRTYQHSQAPFPIDFATSTLHEMIIAEIILLLSFIIVSEGEHKLIGTLAHKLIAPIARIMLEQNVKI